MRFVRLSVLSLKNGHLKKFFHLNRLSPSLCPFLPAPLLIPWGVFNDTRARTIQTSKLIKYINCCLQSSVTVVQPATCTEACTPEIVEQRTADACGNMGSSIYDGQLTMKNITRFLANVNSRSRSLFAVARPSVVCNVRASYSGGSNFRQYFYGIRYLGHPLTSTENFT